MQRVLVVEDSSGVCCTLGPPSGEGFTVLLYVVRTVYKLLFQLHADFFFPQAVAVRDTKMVYQFEPFLEVQSRVGDKPANL